ncbi:hypothetical protein [Mycobacterium sp. 1423905.2]|uniref:hypothetical protein n=1 Tax=Mycobacterium sp. 1423905.2 TaxID=1856859 RepID=UPI000800C5CC|nr:hypothetical protein [Mycobacterium sp. 1423905.2]OBJ49560.1 hypothetical protein A9W95_25710 [Mycobacterium sp. 1423905.2]
MADRLDVAGRLAEGRPALDHAETYIRACQAVGYDPADLNARLRDAYDSEDGLDLHVLDGDCAQLRAAGAAVGEALQVERAQLAALATAWTGPAADNAVRFLERHCDTGTAMAAELRAAAQRSESLRDNLWQLVDAKVGTTIAIDDRTLAHRPTWLAAAATVTSGASDRSTAEEVVRRQVVPYVDNDLATEWRGVLQSARTGVQASYDMVTDRMAAAARPVFDIPGDLGPADPPGWLAPPRAPAPDTGFSRAEIPTAATQLAAHPSSAGAPPVTAPAAPANPPGAQPVPDSGASWGGASGGMPSGDGGLGGLGGMASRIVSALGDALGSPDGFDDEGDPFGEDAEDDDDRVAADKHEKADAKKEPGKADEPQPAEQIRGQDAAMAPVAEAVPESQPQPGTEPPQVTAPQPAAAPPTPVPPAPGGKTPCEIAADELPQAGR